MQTQFEFTLPKGYVSDDGTLHRRGTMRLATARDEIEPLRDRTIDGPDDPYLTILVLARVVTELGSVPTVDVQVIEGLFAADLAFLQDLYGIINFGDQADVEALQASVLPDDPEFDDGDGGALDAMSAIVERDDSESDDGDADAGGGAGSSDGTPARPRRARVEEVVSSSRE